MFFRHWHFLRGTQASDLYPLSAHTSKPAYLWKSTLQFTTKAKTPSYNSASKFRPWKIKTAVAFAPGDQAFAFERYLKTSSGRAFARKRL